MKRASAAVLLASISGCAAVDTPVGDDYQLGDGTRRVLELQYNYCEKGDPVARGMLLLITRAAVPGYPADGLCTDLIEVLSNANAR